LPTTNRLLVSALDAYQRHSQDVLQRQQDGKIDLSRVDAMVAVRMCVTDHSQAEAAQEGAERAGFEHWTNGPKNLLMYFFDA
jgi:hypothetical protein